MQIRSLARGGYDRAAARILSIFIILAIAFPVTFTAYAAGPSAGALQSAGTKFLVTTTDDTLDPGDGLCSLREAVIAANTNTASGDAPGECPAGTDDRKDIITLAAGATYALTIPGPNEDEARTGDLDIWDNTAETDLIIGVQDDGPATIEASAVGDRVFDIFGATVNMTGLTLTGGAVGQEAEQAGGAVQNNAGSLTMASSVVTGNAATWGGGIGSWGGTVKLSGTTVSNNTAPAAGGGLFNNAGIMKVDSSVVSGNATDNGAGGGIWSNSALYLASTDVSGNRADGGAGLYVQLDEGVTAKARISDGTTFRGNTASNVGGGISNDGDLSMSGGEVSGNSAAWSGGGIFNRYQATMALDGATVADNSANDGGGLYNEGTLTLTGANVSGNHAGGGGGLTNAGTATIHASQVTGNSVTWAGGGISNRADSSVLIDTASDIAGNSSDDHAAGILNEGGMTIRDSTLEKNTAVYGGGAAFNSGTLTISNSVLSGNSAGQGGALYNTDSGTATIEAGSRVIDGTASDGGGGLFNLGSLTVDGSEVSGNAAPYGGGVNNWSGELTLSNATVSGNSAGNSGGGIQSKSGTVNVQNGSAIIGNSAPNAGGIYNEPDGTLNINDSSVSDNTATDYNGGGIVNAGTLNVQAGTLSGNTASGTEFSSGGALANWGGQVAFTASTLSDNSAAWAAAIFTSGGTLNLDATAVTGNTAQNDAGGIQIKDGSEVMVQNGSEVSDNHSSYGGGIANWGSMLTIDASTVSGNSAENAGGGLLNKDGGSATIRNGSVFSYNVGSGGGGVANWGPSELTADSSTFSGNSASTDAGGALWNSGKLTVTNSTIQENSAVVSGGGLFNWYGGTMSLDASTISRNSAGYGGGLMNYYGGLITLNNSIVSENSALNLAGGLFNLDATLDVTGSALHGNTAPGDGDAVYIVAASQNTTRVNSSCIAGNGDIAVFNEGTDSQDFTGNWWGNASGPSGVGPGTGDSVSDSIDFSNWLTAAPSICAGQ